MNPITIAVAGAGLIGRRHIELIQRSSDCRVVAIGEFDLSPCGGTHCARTSQLGAIRITNSERYKGMTRVTFVAGRRARADRADGRLATPVADWPAAVADATEMTS